VRFDHYENNALKASPSYTMTNGASNVWANWSGVATLQHGGQYGICAQGSYRLAGDSLFISDGPNSCSMGTMLGRRAYTTIDRSKPTTAMTLAGGAAYTKSPQVPVKVDFADDVAGPFPAGTTVRAGTKTYRLKLPKRAKAGSYMLKATYAPERARSRAN
jgi:hypothetical protein